MCLVIDMNAIPCVFNRDALVDQKMNELKALCNDSDFDDPHIAALLIVSGCNILCSEDARSYLYVKRKEWYPNGRKLPKIYKSSTFKNAATIIWQKYVCHA